GQRSRFVDQSGGGSRAGNRNRLPAASKLVDGFDPLSNRCRTFMVTLGVLGLLFGACKRSSEESEPATGPKKIRCASVQTKPVIHRVEVRGTVAPLPAGDAQLAPQVAGRLLKVEVREGDVVKASQEVARVDEAPLLDAVRQADAVLAKTRAEAKNAQAT